MNAFASVICVVLAERLGQRAEVSDRRLRAVVGGQRLLHAIERIDHQHRVARLREPLAHLPERGSQAEDVGADDHAGCHAARRMHEIGVRLPVRRRHGDVRLRHIRGIGHRRQRHRHAGRDHDAELAARHLAERFELLPIVLEVILIAHDSSS
jgi:hypothetical protein